MTCVCAVEQSTYLAIVVSNHAAVYLPLDVYGRPGSHVAPNGPHLRRALDLRARRISDEYLITARKKAWVVPGRLG